VVDYKGDLSQQLSVHRQSHPDGAIFVESEETKQSLHNRRMDEASSRFIYSEVAPHIHQLRDVLTPRVIQFGDDHVLVEALIDVETAERHWISNLELIEHWGAPEAFGWSSAASLLTALATVSSHLAAKEGN